jgi:2-polyprenyl-6-methoxyphenol hydroxylase-like FAD-dependent oxidoreductase
MDRERIAVVGSGMAGLATAWALHNDPAHKFDVTVFEKVLSTESVQNLPNYLMKSRATHVRSTGIHMHPKVQRIPALTFLCASSRANTMPISSGL